MFKIVFFNKGYFFAAAIVLCVVNVFYANDVLLEFKGAYFLPTNSEFRHIYDNGGALYGPEVTFKFCEQLYGFASVDFFQKSGNSLMGCSPTQITMVPLGMGFKYLVPFCYGDFYVGLGFQPTYVQITNCSPYVITEQTQWGFGGIAKIGSYFNLPYNLLLDIFIDYSFINLCFKDACASTGPILSNKAHLSGTIFGAGLGYRFN